MSSPRPTSTTMVPRLSLCCVVNSIVESSPDENTLAWLLKQAKILTVCSCAGNHLLTLRAFTIHTMGNPDAGICHGCEVTNRSAINLGPYYQHLVEPRRVGIELERQRESGVWDDLYVALRVSNLRSVVMLSEALLLFVLHLHNSPWKVWDPHSCCSWSLSAYFEKDFIYSSAASSRKSCFDTPRRSW